MKYMVRKSFVQVVGTIWLPPVTAATTYPLRQYDIDNARDDAGAITRESVEQWLYTHAGDFQSIDDFSASIEDGEDTIDIPWESEDAECTFYDCMYPEGD